MNALIVDDDPLVGLTLKHFLEKADPASCSSQVMDGAAALRELAGGKFDAVFLDLELPEVDGRQVLAAVPADLPVIVISCHTDFGAKSYDFNVVDYLVKPLEFSRFHRAWQKLTACMGARLSIDAGAIVVRDGAKLVRIPLDRLLFFEAESNYTRLVCADRSLLALVSLKRLMETLPGGFWRVHRSYIVNARQIDQIEGTTIKIGAHKIPIGESYRESLFKRFAPVN